jgi:hypothetical protein
MPESAEPQLTWEYRVHYLGRIRAGWSFTATTKDETGWIYTGLLVETDAGLVVRELTVRPTSGSPEFEGDWQAVADATAESTPMRGVNTSVLKRFSFEELRKTLDEHLAGIRALLDRSPGSPKQAAGPEPRGRDRLRADLERHARLIRKPNESRGGAPPFPDHILAEQARTYLETARTGRGHRRRLMNEWDLTSEYSVDTRRKHLNNAGWVNGAGLHAEPGDALREWWTQHPDQRPSWFAGEEENR